MIDGFYDAHEENAKSDLEKIYTESNETLESKDVSRKRLGVIFKLIETIYSALKNETYHISKRLEELEEEHNNHKTYCGYVIADGKDFETKSINVLKKETKYTMPLFKWVVSLMIPIFISSQIYIANTLWSINLKLMNVETKFLDHEKADNDRRTESRARIERLEKAIFKQ